MTAIDVEGVAQQMITTAKAVLGEKWPEAKNGNVNPKLTPCDNAILTPS